MAFPTYVNKGTFAHQATGSSLSVGLPSGWQEDDILIITLLHANPGSAVPSGWTRVSTEQDYGNRSLSVFAKRAGTSEGSVSCTLTGGGSLGNCCAQMEAYRGCSTSGNGWEAAAGSTDTTVEVAFSSTTLTTLGVDRLVHVSAGQSGDTAGQRWSNWAGTGLANVTERVDDGFTDGTGGSIATAHGEKATAGSAGPFTADKDGARADANVIMALIPESTPVVVSATDSLTLAEAVERVVNLLRSPVDSLSFSESLTRIVSLFRDTTDNIGLSDSVIAVKITPREATDALSLGDVAIRVLDLFRSTTDALGLGDSVARVMSAGRTTSDGLTLSESAVAVVTSGAQEQIMVIYIT